MTCVADATASSYTHNILEFIMNEQIKLLAEQAFVITTDGKLGHVNTYMVEKFSELLIKECTTTILKESKWYWDKDEFESSNAVQNAARRVKEHFGVEE